MGCVGSKVYFSDCHSDVKSKDWKRLSMPSALKARNGRPSIAEMKADLKKLWKPDARTMEALYDKYLNQCMAETPPLKQIHVQEVGLNWKALIMSMPPPQNSTLLGCGIRRIFLAETECVYSGVYRFHVERLDGTWAMFDFRDAYDDPYHHYKEQSFTHDVELALRAAVLPQLIEYKEMLSKDSQLELVSHISGVALPWEKAVVQHFPVTFQALVDAFMNENQTRCELVKLDFDDDHGYRLKDKDLADRWRIFHRSLANFRVISTEEAMEQDHL